MLVKGTSERGGEIKCTHRARAWVRRWSGAGGCVPLNFMNFL